MERDSRMYRESEACVIMCYIISVHAACVTAMEPQDGTLRPNAYRKIDGSSLLQLLDIVVEKNLLHFVRFYGLFFLTGFVCKL